MTIKDQINQMVQTGVFAKGTVFTRDQFTALGKKLNKNLFCARKTDRERQRANLALVNIQSSINKQLAHQGYYLKSRDYGHEFYVVTKKRKVAKEVNRYVRTSIRTGQRSILLLQGLSDRK